MKTLELNIVTFAVAVSVVVLAQDTCNYELDSDYYAESDELNLRVECGLDQASLFWSSGDLDTSLINSIHIDFICSNDTKVRNLYGYLFGNAMVEDPLTEVHRNPMPTAAITGSNSSDNGYECQYFGCYYYNNDVIYTFETVTCTFGKPTPLSTYLVNPSSTSAVSSTKATNGNVLEGTTALDQTSSSDGVHLNISPTIMRTSSYNNDGYLLTSSSLELPTVTPQPGEVGVASSAALSAMWVAVGSVALAVILGTVLLLAIGIRRHSSKLFHKNLKHPLRVIPHCNDEPLDVNLEIVTIEPQGLSSSHSQYSIVTHIDPFEYSPKTKRSNSLTSMGQNPSLDARRFLTSSYIQFDDLVYQDMSNFLELNNMNSDRVLSDEVRNEEHSNNLNSTSECTRNSTNAAKTVGNYHISLDEREYVELCPVNDSTQVCVSELTHQDNACTCNSDIFEGSAERDGEKILDNFTFPSISREVTDQTGEGPVYEQSSQSHDLIGPVYEQSSQSHDLIGPVYEQSSQSHDQQSHISCIDKPLDGKHTNGNNSNA